ncbi:MAG: Rieske (2Fe-2S) protein [Gammaproteobacteria bacterium]
MIELCKLEELVEQKTKGFDFEIDDSWVGLFVVHHEGEVYGYLNRCPHVGTPLNWVPDRFLDSEGEYLQCATHGALFRIEDGYCEFGPCAGESLSAATIVVRDGTVYWCKPD